LATLADISALVAETRFSIRAFSFSKTKVDKNSTLRAGVVEEVGRLDITVKDLVVVNTLESGEEFSQVDRDFGDGQVAKVCSEVSMSEVWQDGYDLICFSKGGDERANRRALAKVVKQLKLVQNARGT
jgi:hypothetical protein